MRIVITSNYELGNETGTAHVAEELSNYLAKKNEVTYICLGDRYYLKKLNKNLTILHIPSVEINSVSVPLITPDVVFKTFIYLHKFKPRVIHSQNSLFISNLVQIWANLNNVPFIVTFHHIPTEAISHLFPKLPKNIITNIVSDLYRDLSLKKFLINTDVVIALNKFVHESIRTVDKEIPIKIVNNGLELSKLIKINRKEKLSKKLNFVFIGSYNERKNQEFLTKVFSNLPENYILNLYGNKKSGKNYVKKLGLQIKKSKLKNVFINDYHNNITEIYKGADFFISASLKEAQSLVVVEALASGVPIIGLENETIIDLINKDNGLTCSKNISPKKFAEFTLYFIKNSNYKNLSKNARESVESFKIKNVALEIEKIYESTTCRNSKNSRRNVGNYYQEIFERIVIK